MLNPLTLTSAPESSVLWKTMQGVSAQGKKRGRANNLLRKKNLNIGQRLGFGKAKIDFPGLTSKVMEGSGAKVEAKFIQPMRWVINQYCGFPGPNLDPYSPTLRIRIPNTGSTFK